MKQPPGCPRYCLKMYKFGFNFVLNDSFYFQTDFNIIKHTTLMKKQVNKDAVGNIRFVLLGADRIHLRI